MYIVPFDSETLKKIITGELDSPEVSYKDSTIKGKNFITYFSNLKYKTVIINFEEISVEEKKELVTEYIKHNSNADIEQLLCTMIKIIFYQKGYSLPLINLEHLQKSILTNSEVAEFVQENQELVKTLCQILDGVLLYAIKNLNAYKEDSGDFITNNIVVEKQEVGKTFVNVFHNETFNSHYYAGIPNFNDIKYFEFYFDRPIYSGRTLMNYITSENCLIYPILKLILDMTFTPEQLISMIKEADATLI
jgi:uncharacterized protein YwlG (UPF0340 family)